MHYPECLKNLAKGIMNCILRDQETSRELGMFYISICMWFQGFQQSKIYQAIHSRRVHVVLHVYLSLEIRNMSVVKNIDLQNFVCRSIFFLKLSIRGLMAHLLSPPSQILCLFKD